MVKRKAARFVTADYRRRHSVTVLLNQLQWQTLLQRRTHSKVTMLYRIHQSITNLYPSQPIHLISYTPALQTVATICINTTAASTPNNTPSSLASSTCGTNCHQTQWELHRSICSRTDLPPSRCANPLYWTMFYQHLTMHCFFYQFLLISSIFTRMLSLAHLSYSWSKQKRIRTVRQYPGSLAHPRGMYFNGKEGRKDFIRTQKKLDCIYEQNINKRSAIVVGENGVTIFWR